jgi:hypothetical protein
LEIFNMFKKSLTIIGMWSFLFCFVVHAEDLGAASQKLRPLAYAQRAGGNTAGTAPAAAAINPRIAEIVKRAQENILQRYLFEYGSMPQDHYLTAYVRQQLREAMGQEADGYDVVVAPAWNSPNACAIGNTIIVSRALLELVQHPAELQAALAHEAIHIRRLHVVISAQAAESESGDIQKLILRNIGLLRMQEYESDLRWIVEQFNKRGINPLGLVVLRERLASFVEDAGIESRSTAYGGLADMALNAESIFYLIDLKSLDSGLGQLPPDYQRALKQIPEDLRYGLFNADNIRQAVRRLPARGLQEGIIHLLDRLSAAEAPLFEFRERKIKLARQAREITGELRFENKRKKIASLRRGLKQLHKEISELNRKIEDTKARVTPLREALEALAERTDNELFSVAAWPDPKKRAMARGLFYELHCGKPYLFTEKPPHEILAKRQAEDNAYIKTTEDLDEIVKLTRDPAFISLDAGGINTSASSFTGRVSLAYAELSGLYESPTRGKMEACVGFLLSADAAADRLMETKGTRPANSTPWRVTDSLENIIRKMPGGHSELKESAWSMVWQRGYQRPSYHGLSAVYETDQLAWQISDIAEAKAGQQFNAADYEGVMGDIWDLVQQRRLDAGSFMGIFSALEGMKDERTTQPGAQSGTELSTAAWRIREPRYGYVLYRLFEQGLSRFDLAPEERSFLLDSGIAVIAYGDRAVSAERPDGSLSIICDMHKYSAGEDAVFCVDTGMGRIIHVLNPADERYMAERISGLDRRWFSQPFGLEQVKRLYRLYNSTGCLKDTRVVKIIGSESFPDVLFSRILAMHLTQYTEWDDIFGGIARLEAEGVPVNDIISRNPAIFSLTIARLWQTLPENPDRRQIGQVRAAARFVSSPFLAAQLRSYYYEKAWDIYTAFDERLDMLIPAEDGGYVDLDRVNAFIEKEARTKGQLAAVRQRVLSRIDCALTRGSAEVGIAAIIDMVKGNPESAQKFVNYLLATSAKDTDLRDFIYEIVDNAERYAAWSFMGSVAAADAYSDDWKWARIQRNRQNADLAMRLIYEMGPLGKRALFRRVSTNPVGLISKPKWRGNFLNSLVKGVVTESAETAEQDRPLRGVIDRIVTAVGACGRWKPVYFALDPTVSPRLGVLPEHPTPWRDVPSYSQDIFHNELQDELDALEIEGGGRYGSISSIQPEHEQRPWRYESPLLEYGEDLLRQRLQKAGVARREAAPEPVSPLSFVINSTEKTGALGVRFLQLTPLFMRLPDRTYEDKFSRVRDAVHGQSKPAAVAAVEREWPQVWDYIETFEEYVGGGSMMTAYKVMPKGPDAASEVIKVLNPNLQYFLDTNSRFVDEVLTQLERRFGRENYRAARMVFEKVKEWIRRDCNFENFLEHDAAFRGQNNGFSVGGMGCRIYVPRSYGPASKYFIREEYVEGKNLTEWDALVAGGCDMKAVVSLILHNYIHQLQQGLVHSDVHEGNFKVMPKNGSFADGDVAILDRNFFLRLNAEMQALINDAILNPTSILGMEPAGLLDKIAAVCPGLTLTAAQRERLAAANGPIAAFKSVILSGDISAVNGLLVALNEEGIDLPLEIILVFKNITAIQQMARRAGFDIMGAYLYPMSRSVSPGRVIPAKDKMPELEASVLRPLAAREKNLQ